MRKAFYLEKPEKLVEIALKKASRKASRFKGKKDKKSRIEKKAVLFSNYLLERIDRAVVSIPSKEGLNAFHFELLKTIEGEQKINRMRSHFLTVKKLLLKRKRAALKRIRSGKGNAQKDFSELIGRSRSILESLNKTIKELNSLQRKIKELPDIDFKTKTLILAGYPNVGKTTILKRLTGSSPKIAEYPFTTKKLNLGYFEWRHRKIQVIDTPGLLDRALEKRNAIERKAVLALKHLAGLIGFIVDCSEQAIELKEQLALFESIKKAFNEKKIVVLLNKLDIATKEQVMNAKKMFESEEIIEFPEEKSREIREFLGAKLFQEGS